MYVHGACHWRMLYKLLKTLPGPGLSKQLLGNKANPGVQQISPSVVTTPKERQEERNSLHGAATGHPNPRVVLRDGNSKRRLTYGLQQRC